MSAIFGFINKNGTPADVRIAGKMQSSMLATGVDGRGTYLDGPAFLGHHQMIVHQRQETEKQPFTIGSYVICCDSHLENFEQLRNKFQGPTEIRNDADLIIRSYIKWGTDCVTHFTGEFAFAIWNVETAELFLAVDHIGFRTLYYYESNDQFIFSSEIKAIEAIKTTPFAINEDYFVKYYSGNYSDQTYDANIRLVPAAHYIQIRDAKKAKRKYWRIAPLNVSYKTNEEWFDALHDVIEKKISVICETNYTVGVWLSGGLDSSFITALTCIEMKKKR